MLWQDGGSFDDQGIIAATGLPNGANTAVLMIWAFVGSIVFAFLFPRILCPLFLKVKNKVRWRYKDAYIQTTRMPLSKRKLITRSIYLFLLALGLLSFLLPLIDPVDWLPDGQKAIKYYEGELGVPGEYVVTVMSSMIFIIAPFTVGLWSVSWVMEDAGLMHYKFDDRKGRELYEIEPIHINYSSYLKGYAGISSIFFLIQVAITWSQITESTGESRTSDILFTVLQPLLIILLCLPAYLIYAKFGSKADYLTKDLEELKPLSEEEILKS